MIAAVFDSVVYVQAAISSRGPATLASQVEDGQVEIVASPAIFEEVRDVLPGRGFARGIAI